MSKQTFQGFVKEVGGKEVGASGHEKPRKVLLANSPDATPLTFRAWGDSAEFAVLEKMVGQRVTVEYNAEERAGPKGPYTQKMIVNVSDNGSPAEWPAPVDSAWKPPGDEDAPPSVAPAPLRPDPAPRPEAKRDEWDERGAQMEAAWGLKAALDLEGGGDDDELLQRAIGLIILKRRLASEMTE